MSQFTKDFAAAIESAKEKEIRQKLHREFITTLLIGMTLAGVFGWLLP